MEGLGMQFWQTLTKGQNSQLALLQKTLRMNLNDFEHELDHGMYGDTDMLQLIKYLCQNRNNCLFFELKITIIINRLISIYSL